MCIRDRSRRTVVIVVLRHLPLWHEICPLCEELVGYADVSGQQAERRTLLVLHAVLHREITLPYKNKKREKSVKWHLKM